ncbi:MAG: uncharacterized protein KVP18_000324 [Porospora cf. gigantea A]|uniref:uncharacterized protein n=2 Tax=Porospora cf. gigantea A TaxID=2853593 RepID=UPI003559B1B2|nr:MAG: hypothetical protein KVP18_000324 [Porospora cf. gigantea A]
MNRLDRLRFALYSPLAFTARVFVAAKIWALRMATMALDWIFKPALTDASKTTANPKGESKGLHSDQFLAATDYVRTRTDLGAEDLLRFYSLYKQATVGPCDQQEPSQLNVLAHRKWEAWHSLGTMDHQTASRFYVDGVILKWGTDIVEGRDPDDIPCPAMGGMVPQSVTLVSDDAVEAAVGLVGAGNVEGLKELLIANPNALQGPFCIPLMNIAADRDELSMCRFLAEQGVKETEKDEFGDTAFHTAAVAGSAKVLRWLAAHHAVPASVREFDPRPISPWTEVNSDGEAPLDLMEDALQCELVPKHETSVDM